MGETRQLIEDVQKQTNADDRALATARERRNDTFAIGRTFPGVTTSYRSGSVAAGVVAGLVHDADGGIVLDRRSYPSLGPDGDGESPDDVVADLQAFIGPKLREIYPNAVVRKMKRGLRIHIHDPLPDGQDPYVDVVVAMQRRDAEGLWIPNMNAGDWNASHPQKHVQLLVSGSRALRRVRAQVIRLVKVWNKQYTNPALNSFNVCALGLESITEPAPIQDALLTFFEHAVDSLKIRRTEDPAGVSGTIKLEQPKDITLQRLTLARDHLRAALDADDDRDAVQAEMHEVFWKYVPAPVTLDSKAAVAAALRTGTPRLRATPGMGVTSMPMVAGTVKPKRAFGGRLG